MKRVVDHKDYKKLSMEEKAYVSIINRVPESELKGWNELSREEKLEATINTDLKHYILKISKKFKIPFNKTNKILKKVIKKYY